MTALYTTFALARQRHACTAGLAWAEGWVAARDGDDDAPIPLAAILDDAPAGDALDWALWSLRAVPPEQAAERDRLARLFACDCVAHVLPIFEVERPGDTRPREAIAVARRFAVGEATAEEMAAAGAAAWAAAAWAAAWDAARDAARDAAWAAWAAAWAARDAAWAARDAARDAAWAARDAARDAERAWQADRLRAYLTGAELPPVEPVNVAVAS